MSEDEIKREIVSVAASTSWCFFMSATDIPLQAPANAEPYELFRLRSMGPRRERMHGVWADDRETELTLNTLIWIIDSGKECRFGVFFCIPLLQRPPPARSIGRQPKTAEKREMEIIWIEYDIGGSFKWFQSFRSLCAFLSPFLSLVGCLNILLDYNESVLAPAHYVLHIKCLASTHSSAQLNRSFSYFHALRRDKVVL